MSEAGKAVFLSYASQDAEAAKRICDALRTAGVEVWFDQNELIGGDAWDQKIRKQIKECALFVPIISANTNARAEGYFRLEWKLAVDRTHLLADDAPFLFPIVLGDLNDATARVPDKFREVQWTRLFDGNLPPEVLQRFLKLWSHRTGALAHESADVPARSPGEGRPHSTARKPGAWRYGLAAVIALALLGGGGFSAYRWYYRKQERAVLEALNMAPDPPIKRDGRVLVATFDNRTGNPARDDLGRQLAEHVRRRLPDLAWVAQAIALRATERLTEEASAAEMRALAERTGADTLVTGYYRQAGDRIQFHGQAFDLKRAVVFAELAPVEGELATSAAVIEETAERLVGVLIPLPRVRHGRQDANLFFDLTVPRRFDSAQLAEHGRADDLERYRRAYEMDPKGGLGSLVALALAHVSRREYVQADAVLSEVETKGLARLPEYPRQIVRWIRALLDGDSGRMAETVERLCHMAPSSRFFRLERGLGHYRANRPRAMLAEFEGITTGSPGERLSTVWRSRIIAYFLLDDLANLEVAARRLQAVEDDSETAYWAGSYVAFRRGDFTAALKFLDGYDGLRGRGDSAFNLYVASLAVMRAEGRAESPEFATLVRRADAWLASRSAAEAKQLETRITRAEVAYLAGRYPEALRLGQELQRERPDDVRVQGFIGTAAARLGDRQLAEDTIARLRALDQRFSFGYPRFAEAKIAAVLGRQDEALQLLREAFAQYTVMIKDFSWEGLRLSPDFESLRSDLRYQEFIKPRG